MGGGFRWIRPEVYPLVAVVATALGICGFSVGRNLTTHPEVRINKKDRQAGYLENFKGEKYRQTSLHTLVKDCSPQVFVSLNEAFGSAK
ncbi:hypothetical protein KP509_04G105300 [Ceratopteris richardii]|uniref:NADH-ubiquinone reductase complex 1 MLRQ subunit n=1 Tax=Ceratopteris richardii TaxID=49495 RepID=A0A8T2V098_CERRI|nr:hypothetical protein KP509_04G105300 [Ceratopteris richardii]